MTHIYQSPDDWQLVDQYGRYKRKLRVSLTDRCNFKCVYCMPEHPNWIEKKNLLSFEALYQFCYFMVQHGIEDIRITGGEPLMRRGVVHFVSELQHLKKFGLKRISMTTNGHYLAQYAQQLKYAGLDDLNISLDSLSESQFEDLTKKQLAPVLNGIYEAIKVGLKIKINSVLMQGKNQDQIIPLVKWAKGLNIPLRFIEFMPLDGDQHWSPYDVVDEAYILNTLQSEFHVSTALAQKHHPARTYLIDGHPIGIISTISHAFCGSCDRVRLTATGDFYHCLFAPKGLALKPHIQALLDPELSQSDAVEQLKLCIQPYLWHKASGFAEIQQQNLQPSAKQDGRKISMHMLGG